MTLAARKKKRTTYFKEELVFLEMKRKTTEQYDLQEGSVLSAETIYYKAVTSMQFIHGSLTTKQVASNSLPDKKPLKEINKPIKSRFTL